MIYRAPGTMNRGFYCGDLVVQRTNHHVWDKGVRLGIGRVVGLESTKGPGILVVWHIGKHDDVQSVWEYVQEIERISPLHALAKQLDA